MKVLPKHCVQLDLRLTRMTPAHEMACGPVSSWIRKNSVLTVSTFVLTTLTQIKCICIVQIMKIYTFK